MMVYYRCNSKCKEFSYMHDRNTVVSQARPLLLVKGLDKLNIPKLFCTISNFIRARAVMAFDDTT